MLGIFALAGMLGTPIVAGKMLKKDISNYSVDYRVQPCTQYNPISNVIKNKKTIEKEFLNICKRCGMKLNKQNELLDARECKIGEEYLIYQGFDKESVEYFKELFNENLTIGKYRQKREIREKHQRYLEMIENYSHNWGMTVYRRNYYGNEKIDYRINKLMENKLWNRIVYDEPQCIDGDGTAKYMEIYSINAPKPIINDLDNIYKEVCWLQRLEDGGW
ncbi:hypothetical protein [Methanobrevibacter sp. V14]|uniref:hypothetical protein n=1 Tax=Methanobrevibacter sp. V14 TaxID=3064280 RepID=UPI002734122F|nr:hypothetical protein [Methanobrevibacter sp. V14]